MLNYVPLCFIWVLIVPGVRNILGFGRVGSPVSDSRAIA